MPGQQTRASARRAFLEQLIDDAGLFPPAQLPMHEALRLDDVAARGPAAWMLGRFVVPAARLGELLAQREDALRPLCVSLIADAEHVVRDVAAALEAVLASPAPVQIASLEVRLPDAGDGDVPSSLLRIVADVDASGLQPSLPVYLEIGFGVAWREHVTAQLNALADARSRSVHDICAKIRCGGIPPLRPPSSERLAFTIGTLRALDVPFKATAGLHHALRGIDPATGTPRHGFLNVIGVAVLDYELDLDEAGRIRVLEERDAAAFTVTDDRFSWRDLVADGAMVAAARRHFVHAYGSCSFSEPVEELQSLGILT